MSNAGSNPWIRRSRGARAMPRFQASAGPPSTTGAPSSVSRPVRGLEMSRLVRRSAPASARPAKPRISPCAQFKREVLQSAAVDPMGREHDPVSFVRRDGVNRRRRLVPGHQLNQLRLGRLPAGKRRPRFAVAQDADRVGDGEDLVEPMRNVKDPAAPRVATNSIMRKSLADSSPVNAAVGSSITKMRAGAPESSRKAAAILTSIRSPTERRDMLVSGAEVINTERLERRTGPRVERPPVDQSKAVRIAAAEENVFGGAEARRRR